MKNVMAISLNKRPFDETASPPLKMLRFSNKFGTIPWFLFLSLNNSKIESIFDNLKAAAGKLLFADKISGVRAERPGWINTSRQ
jgi:hypothetical protein